MVKPQMSDLKASTTSADLLNVIRNDASPEYQAAVPEAQGGPDGNLREIGTIMLQYDWVANQFLNSLVNRIGRVIITSRLYENPWAFFKKGLLEYGETVEELFVQMAKPHDYDPQVGVEKQWQLEIPDVRAAFHTMNYQKFYKTSVNNDQLRQAFLGDRGIIDLIGRIIDALYTGANYDEFITMKYMIARMALDGYFYPVAMPDLTKENGDQIVENIRATSNLLLFPSDQYNYAGVTTYTDRTSQYLITGAQFDASIDVNVLSSAFNMDKVEFMGHRVLVDGFDKTDDKRLAELFGGTSWFVPFTSAEKTKLKTIQGILVDRDWFMIFDNYYNMTSKYNGENLYWNYWYHKWSTFSASPFQSAILFASGNQAVTGVTVDPATATVTKGASTQFTSTVAGTGFVSKSVEWSITGAASAQTYITTSGLLHVGADETATSITVNATSKFDSTKAGTAAVTVTA